MLALLQLSYVSPWYSHAYEASILAGGAFNGRFVVAVIDGMEALDEVSKAPKCGSGKTEAVHTDQIE